MSPRAAAALLRARSRVDLSSSRAGVLPAWLRTAGLTLAVFAAAGSGVPSAASAEEQPAILKAYGLDWIERVSEDAWPQPKAQRPVICLLDTGVNITPDTPADDPNGPIVARLALDGGTGFAQGTEWQHEHGTQMAAIIAAPRNGYGTVGVFPQARIVSIRVTEGAETFITPEAVAQGVKACLQFAARVGVRVAAISVSESNYNQRAADLPIWQTALRGASDAQAVLVAAAGNDEDSVAVAPLAVPAILTVSAGDDSGGPCDFVAGLLQPGALRGPGCARSRAWPPGSSAATAATAALIAALVTRSPDATAESVRSSVLGSATTVAGVQVLRAGSFGVGILGDPSTSPAQSSIPDTAATGERGEPSVRLWKPRVAASWARGRLRVRRLDKRDRGRMVVALGKAASAPIVRGSAGAREISKRLGRKPRQIRVWIESTDGRSWRSLAIRSGVR